MKGRVTQTSQCSIKSWLQQIMIIAFYGAQLQSWSISSKLSHYYYIEKYKYDSITNKVIVKNKVILQLAIE